ncbi:MAG: DUF501 domain-containing protein [Leptospirales bacterium]|nr:DUF501 domain-containing protein [Leptospirales bacterium]
MVDPADAETVARQLETQEVFIVDVAARCPHGCPSVALLSPLKKNGAVSFTAIATPLWLTCPFLNRKIHDLESSGFIKKIRRMIDADDSLLEEISGDRENYAAYRNAAYRVFFSSRRGNDALRKMPPEAAGGSGINSLKCLHFSAAHYAACRQNTAGRIVFELLGKETFCQTGGCLKR